MNYKVDSPSTLDLLAFFGSAVSAALYRTITYPVRCLLRSHRAPTFKKDVLFAAIRSACDILTIAHSRFLLPSTTEQYQKFCAAKNISPRSITVALSDVNIEATAHWVGEPDADIVVLYLHGGAYTQPGSEGYLHFWSRLIKDLKSESKSIAMLQLAYSLAPEACYPTQLREAAAILAHLLSERTPSSIILAGDSAGGNLALCLLSHILHPHEDKVIPRIDLKQGKLGGALLISPWVTFGQEHDSFTRNYETDFLAPRMLRRSVGMFLSPSAQTDIERDPGRVYGDAYTEPLTNASSWWEGLHSVVDEVFVWYGEGEVLADAIAEFEGAFGKGWSEGGGDKRSIVFVKSPGRAHIEPIMSVMLEPKVKGDHQVAVEEWLKARFV